MFVKISQKELTKISRKTAPGAPFCARERSINTPRRIDAKCVSRLSSPLLFAFLLGGEKDSVDKAHSRGEEKKSGGGNQQTKRDDETNTNARVACNDTFCSFFSRFGGGRRSQEAFLRAWDAFLPRRSDTRESARVIYKQQHHKSSCRAAVCVRRCVASLSSLPAPA